MYYQKSYSGLVSLTPEVVEELHWWIRNLPLYNGRKITLSTPDIIIHTDASRVNRSGWGATCGARTAGGRWTNQEKMAHINVLELQAAWFGVMTFAKNLRHGHVLLRSDNMATVAYINKMGGTRSQEMSKIAIKLWQWCLDRHITITAKYLPGIENDADYISRHHTDSADWKLLPLIFQTLQQAGPVLTNFDLFASRTNHQLPQYASWHPDPQAAHTDAFQLDWSVMIPYAFPPFALIGRCVRKMCRQKVQWMMLITPLWKGQPWFPLLLKHSAATPCLLPLLPDLLLGPTGEQHPLVAADNLQLVAWWLSSNTSLVREFQDRLPHSSYGHGGRVLNKLTLLHGGTGVIGVVNRRSIPCHHLWQRFWTT